MRARILLFVVAAMGLIGLGVAPAFLSSGPATVFSELRSGSLQELGRRMHPRPLGVGRIAV